MDNNHRYRPYNRTDRRHDDRWKYPSKKSNKYSSRYSSHSERRNSNDLSYRRSYKNDYHSRHQHHQPTRSRTFSYFSSPAAAPPPPQPLMSTIVLPPAPVEPPPPPAPVGPQERESWIRSVKKTNTNESTEQKTQYLETMLRMPQQKSLLKSSRFDRMRFADEQLGNSSTGNSSMINNEHFDQNSFHLIDDLNNHEEICTLEKILFNNDLQVQEKTFQDHQSVRSIAFLEKERK